MAQWQEAGRRWQALWVPEAEHDGAETLGADDDHEHEDEALGAQANANANVNANVHVNAKYGWRPLFAASDAPELVQTLATRHQRALVWLTSPRALAREGRAMQHCVASFTDECAHQREHVASMRDLSGQRLSTLRVRLHYVDGQWVPELLEHRGMMNAAPNAFCGAAVRAVMQVITEPDTRDHLQARWVELEAARKLRWAARVATRGERHRESVAEHRAVLDEVLPPGMAAALGG